MIKYRERAAISYKNWHQYPLGHVPTGPNQAVLGASVEPRTDHSNANYIITGYAH